MWIAIGSLLGLLGIIITFFLIPFSKTRREFKSLRDGMLRRPEAELQVFSKEDLAHLPDPVKKYFDFCGFLGTPKMTAMKAKCEKVKFKFKVGDRPISIDYTQYNLASEPARIAYIDSSKFGIPFEGLDSFQNGKGSMKGVLGKLFTVFDQTGKNMDRAALVTYLSESLIIPSAALNKSIVWEGIDDRNVKATISHFGMETSGVFAFGENGELQSFTTDDREATDLDGTIHKYRWTAVFSDYEEIDGIRKPTSFQAIWHYLEWELLYFDAKGVKIEFDPQLLKKTLQ